MKITLITMLTSKKTASKISLLALALLGAGLSIQLTSCASGKAGRATTVGVLAAFDCEAAHLDEQLLADAEVFAKDKVKQWLANGEKPSSTKIVADLAPLRTDLMKCAVAGAVAAALALLPTSRSTTEPSALAATSPNAGLRDAYEEARRKLGWGPIRLADGTVL